MDHASFFSEATLIEIGVYTIKRNIYYALKFWKGVLGIEININYSQNIIPMKIAFLRFSS